MIRRSIEIITSSFKMALQELWKNKLRTFLSLFGVTIGIFCIIGILTIVNSLERNIKNEVKALGNNTIYLDKWDWTGGSGGDYPAWKFANRPSPKYSELQEIMERTPLARYAAFKINIRDNIEFENSSLSGVILYGITEQFNFIQPIDVMTGRYISEADFRGGAHVVVIGVTVAEKLFGDAGNALGKIVSSRGKKLEVIGVIKKQGKQMIGGWNFDENVLLPYQFARTIIDERRAEPLLMIQGHEGVSPQALKEELTRSVRTIRKLKPLKEDDFTLNDVNDFNPAINDAFSKLNLGGWAIAGLSLIVGMFGVANIMFVSVRERTSQIGLKKAVGAKRRVILAEFLLESAFLCIIGGFIGLTLVFLMSEALTSLFKFPVFISLDNVVLAIVICIIVGVLAGFIPARQAARMDPVVAIRS